MPARILTIPLSQIQPHPRLSFRFSYDVASLADSIRSSVDENTPNGQLNPGRIVRRPEGEGFYDYVGVRRFLALELLLQKTKDERFGVYNAYLDEGLSELEMFVRARAENEEERGERLGLSILEQASGILKIRDSVDVDKLEGSLKRLYSVAEKLGEQRLKKLYDVERATRSKFKLSQLEALCSVEGEKEFYATAAFTADFGVEDVDVAEKNRDAAFNLTWFPKVFPDYKQKWTEPASKEAIGGQRGSASLTRLLEAHEARVLIARCPLCDGGNMLQIQGEIDFTHLPLVPGGNRETKAADSIPRSLCRCSHCDKEFFVFARHLEGRKYAISSDVSEKFREPEEIVEAIDIRFDFGENTWQRIVDGKVAGPLHLAPRKSKR
ncbi:MAG: hypothetical protein ACRD6W_10340 [Nitrososphaerales archaeon]